MLDILITNGTVITMDGERRIIEDGAVGIKGSRIVVVGNSATVTADYSAERTIDATRKIVMPGIIDAHAHAGHGLIKTMGCDQGDLWDKACELIYTQGSTADFWYAESKLSALERLKTGTTFGVSFLGGGDSYMATDQPQFGDAYCRAVEQVGIRAMLAAGPGKPPFPRRYTRFDAAGKAIDVQVTHANQLATTEQLVQSWHGAADGKLHICVMFPTPKPGEFEVGSAEFKDLVTRAKETHAIATDNNLLWTMDGHQESTIQFTHDHLGVLGQNAFFSHCIDITANEIALCAETGTRVAHNPSAFYSIMGRCPVPELLDAGVTVMICSDGTSPDRSYDMFRHMWQAMHYHRRELVDGDILPPGKVLEMVTIDAAHGLGVGDSLGSLEAGKLADVVLVDMHKPHLYPLVMPVHRLVYFAKGSDVDTVLVNGEVLMEGREVKTVDEDAIMEAAQEETLKAIERTGLARALEIPPNFWGSSRY